ncbi:MAG: 16S rRNA (guanine(527)-N(7))-methyltransferase RsmG [Beijerinckiaceae bacterium]
MSPTDPDPLGPFDVSRETRQLLHTYEALLRRWQGVKNLVAPTTLAVVWERHFRDSLQLKAICPEAKTWVDIGAGAGFPGMVIAIASRNEPGSLVLLIESDNRKCAFLREVARATGAPAKVVHDRAENIVALLPVVDVVTARAVAPLDKLVEIAMPLLENGATGLFPKGREFRAELTRLSLPSTFSVDAVPSQTEEGAAIIVIRGPHARA